MSHGEVSKGVVLVDPEQLPNDELLRAIGHKLVVIGGPVAEARLGSTTLRIVQGNGGDISYEDWHKLNTEEYVNVNRYHVQKSRWWSESWERPQAAEVPFHLRDRVDMSWRIRPSGYADPDFQPPYPGGEDMLKYLETLSWDLSPKGRRPFSPRAK